MIKTVYVLRGILIYEKKLKEKKKILVILKDIFYIFYACSLRRNFPNIVDLSGIQLYGITY